MVCVMCFILLFFFFFLFFFFKQKTAYDGRISDWISDVCSSDLVERVEQVRVALPAPGPAAFALAAVVLDRAVVDLDHRYPARRQRLARAQADHGVEDRILGRGQVARVAPVPATSDERRLGEVGGLTCQSRWSQYP